MRNRRNCCMECLCWQQPKNWICRSYVTPNFSVFFSTVSYGGKHVQSSVWCHSVQCFFLPCVENNFVLLSICWFLIKHCSKLLYVASVFVLTTQFAWVIFFWNYLKISSDTGTTERWSQTTVFEQSVFMIQELCWYQTQKETSVFVTK